MTNLLLRLLNLQAASRKSDPNRVIMSLGLRAGQVVADIGSGGGYYAYRFAKAVGECGKIIAIDVQPQYLQFIRQNADAQGLSNISTLLTRGDQLDLPDQSCDLIFMRNVFHDFTNHRSYFSRIRKALKTNGSVAIIDFKYKPFHKESFFGHYSDEKEIVRIMDGCGFQRHRTFNFLSDQSYNIFTLAMRGRE